MLDYFKFQTASYEHWWLTCFALCFLLLQQTSLAKTQRKTPPFLLSLIYPMASVDSEVSSGPVRQTGDQGRSTNKNRENNMDEGSNGQDNVNKRRRRRKKKGLSCMPKFGCFKIQEDGVKHSFDMEVVDGFGQRSNPTHLVIMVNGLIGSAQNWRFAAKQFLKKYPEDLIVHCSECNPSMLTFDGVDVMGERLAEEVISVIERHPGVKKISFVGHSLGGLVARYAIAKMYGPRVSTGTSQRNRHCPVDASSNACPELKPEGRIAGLEPINFITFATPHLGSRGHRQVPLLCGIHSLEKAAVWASSMLGKTGKHLLLADGRDGKPPLLLRMVHDTQELKFLSALQSFKHRAAYSNARYDSLVGWSTSSIRRRHELPKRKDLSKNGKYRYIVNVEKAKASVASIASGGQVNDYEKVDTEEQMIRGLTTVSWDRIDVSFSGSRQKYLAHSTIQVKSKCTNSDGVDVVQHMIDNFLL